VARPTPAARRTPGSSASEGKFLGAVDFGYLVTLLESPEDHLAELVGISDRDALLAWIDAAGPGMLELYAAELNEAEAYVGGSRRWVVASRMVVNEGGAAHRELSRAVASPVIVRPRARGRRRRSTASRRSSSSSGSGRESDDDDLARPGGRLALDRWAA
jgi:hypothetical protein